MLDNIMLFVKLVENGSFRKAAEQLNIQHSTVSKRIMHLEESLQKTLIIRTTKDFELTKDGKFIYERFKHVSSYTDITLRNFNNNPYSNMDETISIALPTVLSYEIICPHIGKFMEGFPNVKLNLSFHYGKIQNAISEDEIKITNIYLERILSDSDMILTTNNDVNMVNFDYRFMRNEAMKIYCTPEYAQLYGVPTQITDLHNHKIIGALDHVTSKEFDYIKLTQTNTDEVFMLDNSKSQIRSHSVLHAKQIGIHSNYIFGCWESLCTKEVNEGTLIEILPEWKAHEVSFYLLTKKKLNTIEQEVVKFLYRCLGYSGL